MRSLLFVAVGFFLFGCGGSGTSGTSVQSGSQLKLYLFAAPNCVPCDNELPLMEQTLKDKLGGRYANLAVRVFVLNGQNNVRPTQPIADSYKAGFANNGQIVDFDFVPDEWIHKKYRSYYPNRNGQDTIPAAVVANPDDSPLIAYTPGSVSPEQVAAFLSSQLQ